MKTVLGKVVSSKPAPLSIAAEYLSKFAASDNGASPAFAAYLKRTAAAFSELVHLHKGSKSSLGELKVKRDHSNGTLTEGTIDSVNIPTENDLLITDKQEDSERKIQKGSNTDEGEGGGIEGSLNVNEEPTKAREERHHAGSTGMGVEVQDSNATGYGIVADVGDAGKKSKKKRGSDGNVATTKKDQPGGDHDASNVNEVKNDMDSLDGSDLMKEEEKKKRKSNKHEEEEREGAVEIGKDVQSCLHSQNDGNTLTVQKDDDKQTKHKKNKIKNEVKEEEDGSVRSAEQRGKAVGSEVQPFYVGNAVTMQKDGDEQKKHKKNKRKNEVKEERESSDIRSAEQRDHRNVENVVEVVKEQKHNKKRTREAKERDNGANMEIEAANKKESRKRKHERVAGGGLDGSEDVHISKKKRKHKGNMDD